MTQFNINEFMKKEMKEFERENIDYIKVKALYDFKNKRKYDEMIEEKLDIQSPHPTELPMPGEKILNKK